MKAIIWFTNSPDAGDPACLCSWCEQPIGEEEAPLVRLFDTVKNQEARFHLHCASDAGVVWPAPFVADTVDDFDYGDLP